MPTWLCLFEDDYYNHDSEMKGISEIIIAKTEKWSDRNRQSGMVTSVYQVRQYGEKSTGTVGVLCSFRQKNDFVFSVGICITP